MSEPKNLEQAKATFVTLCNALDNREWHYGKDEENLIIDCKAQGDDLPMELTVKVDPDRTLVILFSRLPFVISEEKRLDVAVAVSMINNILVDGCYDYDITSGKLYFRMTNSFIESIIGEDVFGYMLNCACFSIDEYNDKLLMLAKGMITIEQFISTFKN